eukprot:gene7034-11199_t
MSFENDEDKVKFKSSFVSDGATVTLNCCSCLIPIALIVCGAILCSEPTQESNFTAIMSSQIAVKSAAYRWLNSKGCFDCFKYILMKMDRDDFSLAPVSASLNRWFIQCLQITFSCIHFVGPIMLISGGIALSVTPVTEVVANNVGIASIVIGSFLLFSYVFSCCTVALAYVLSGCCICCVTIVEAVNDDDF